MPQLGDIAESREGSPTALHRGIETYGMTAMRPSMPRFGSSNQSHPRSSHESRQSPSPHRMSPWEGAATSPGLNVAPEAVDYFHQETGTRQSWRAVRNLALVAGGRTLLTLGLAGVLEGFVPGPLGANTTPMSAPPNIPGLMGPVPPPGILHHPAIFGLGMAGAIIGLALHTVGLASFYRDTASINLRRARLMLCVGALGAVLVTVGGAYYLHGVIARNADATWEALPMRSLGNFLVFGAIPNSFSSSEIVHGNTPLRNRIFWRDIAFASGGMFMMTWAQISAPTPPAPLYAREVVQSFGIICLAIGGALPRVDTMRAQSDLRMDFAARRASRI